MTFVLVFCHFNVCYILFIFIYKDSLLAIKYAVLSCKNTTLKKVLFKEQYH